MKAKKRGMSEASEKSDTMGNRNTAWRPFIATLFFSRDDARHQPTPFLAYSMRVRILGLSSLAAIQER